MQPMETSGMNSNIDDMTIFDALLVKWMIKERKAIRPELVRVDDIDYPDLQRAKEIIKKIRNQRR